MAELKGYMPVLELEDNCPVLHQQSLSCLGALFPFSPNQMSPTSGETSSLIWPGAGTIAGRHGEDCAMTESEEQKENNSEQMLPAFPTAAPCYSPTTQNRMTQYHAQGSRREEHVHSSLNQPKGARLLAPPCQKSSDCTNERTVGEVCQVVSKTKLVS